MSNEIEADVVSTQSAFVLVSACRQPKLSFEVS